MPELEGLRKAQQSLSIGVPTLGRFLWLGLLNTTKSGCEVGTQTLRGLRQVFQLWKSPVLYSVVEADSKGQYIEYHLSMGGALKNGRGIKEFVLCSTATIVTAAYGIVLYQPHKK